MGKDSEWGGAQRGRGSERGGGTNIRGGRLRKEDEAQKMVVAHRQVQGEEELKEGTGGQKRKELSDRGRASERL